MATTSSKGLIVPVASESADIDVLRAVFQRINDYGMGSVVCTSVTRPASPWQGMLIYETDTTNIMLWTGGAWVARGTTWIPSPGNRPSPSAPGQQIFEQSTYRTWISQGAGWVPSQPRITLDYVSSAAATANGIQIFGGRNFEAWGCDSVIISEVFGQMGFAAADTEVSVAHLWGSLPLVAVLGNTLPPSSQPVKAAAGKWASISHISGATLTATGVGTAVGGVTVGFTGGATGHYRLVRRTTRYPSSMYV